MRKLASAAGSIALAAASLLVMEIVLRFIPSPIQYPPVHEFDDPQSLLGVEIVPSTRVVVREPCLTAVNTTNSLGWRDSERSRERAPGVARIAALGDSFVESSQVEDTETVTRQLESLLGPRRAEVLNFGLSAIGTVQEEILYERTVQSFSPDVVLIFFYENDVMDSSMELARAAGAPRLAYRDSEGKLVSFRQSSALFGLRKWLRIHSTLFRLVKAVHRQLRAWGRTQVAGGQGHAYPLQYAVFEDPLQPAWQRAWADVERALVRLKAEVEPQRQLYLVMVPDILEIDPDPRARIKSEYGVSPPKTFNPLLPERMITDIAAKHGIRTINLVARFRQYREEHRLPYPYFFFSCDGHWSAFGQRIAAEEIAKVLELSLPEKNP